MKKKSGIPIFFSDVVFLIKHHKRKVQKICFLSVAALLFLSLLFYPTYESRGLFKCAEENDSPKDSLSSLLSSSASFLDVPSPITYFKSKRVVYPVIEKLNLQGKILPESKVKSALKNLKDNLVMEYRFLTLRTPRPLHPNEAPLSLADLHYTGSVKAPIFLRFIDNQSFTLSSKHFKVPKVGKLQEPVIFSEGSFTLDLNRHEALKNRHFTLLLKTKDMAMNELLGNLEFTQDDYDPNLLEISFTHPNPKISQAFNHQLMLAYKSYLSEEQSLKNKFQLSYLNRRVDEVNHTYLHDLNDYAHEIKTLALEKGFMDTNREMAALSRLQEEGQKQLSKIDNEIKRIKEFNLDDYQHCDLSFNLESLREILRKKRLNEQKIFKIKSLLQPSLSIVSVVEKDYHHSLDQLQQELSYHENFLTKINNKDPLVLEAKASHPELIVQWIHTYNECLPHILAAQNEDRLIDQSHLRAFYYCKNNLNQFFQDQHKLLNVQTKNLIHRFSSNTPQMEHKLSPELAENLIKKTMENFEITEAEAEKVTCLSEQLKDPGFSVHSLASVLKDSTSQELIKKSGQLYLDLQDTSNFTQKEMKRREEGLKLLKHSLSVHLFQLKQLLNLEKDKLQASLQSLYQLSLESCQQEACILDASIENTLKSRLDSLYNERKILQEGQKSLKSKMAATPSLWVHQKVLEVKSDVNKRLLEEVSRLVETKNVQSNISVLESKIVDSPKLPHYPKNPLLLVKSLFFFMLSLSACFVFFAYRLTTKGPLIYPQYLQAMGQQVLGSFSHAACVPFFNPALPHVISKKDLEQLRTLVRDFKLLEEKQVLYTAFNQAHTFLPFLCQLLCHAQKKPLVLHFSSSSGGLKDLLSAKEKIKDCLSYDYLNIATHATFTEQTLQRPSFQSFLDSFEDRLIIFCYTEGIETSLSKSLYHLATRACLQVKPIDLQEVEIFLDTQKSIFFTFDDPA